MRDKNWDSVLNNNNVQNEYSVFHRELRDVYNTCFPVKTYKYGYRYRKSWLSEGMKQRIQIKNKLFRKSKVTNNPEDALIYKKDGTN